MADAIPSRQGDPAQIIVMTGATAGLGAHALKRLAGRSGSSILVGARGASPAALAGVETIPLDLASLESVRAFAEAVTQRLGDRRIDQLVLNAGIQFGDSNQRSAEGFETTFAVNHLAHYLLARRLLPYLAEGGRLVFTTSDTHDPVVVPTGPKALDTQAWALPPAKGFSGMRAYAASKLCNLLTARSFAALADVEDRSIRVIAYNPGFTLGTALARGAPRWMQRILTSLPTALLLGLAARFKPAFHPGTPERAGEVLAQLVLGEIEPPAGRVYVSLVRGQVTFPDPSELARSDEARDRLWRDSAVMVGLGSS